MNNIESSIPLISAMQRAERLGLRIEQTGKDNEYWSIYRVIDNEFLSTITSRDFSALNCFLAGWAHCKTYYEQEPPSEWFLRVCIEARDKEWWQEICGVESVKPLPLDVNRWLIKRIKEIGDR